MMKYKGYTGSVQFDDDDGTLFGRVLGIRDVITFEGKSVDEVRKAFHDSVDDYLAWCEKDGRPPEKPFSGRFNVRISPDLHAKAVAAAAKADLSLNGFIARAIADEVERA